MRIIINEQQLNVIREAALDDFSYDTLSNIPHFNKRVEYCKQFLGMPIGNGSSRMVFQIDDEKVLKLAKNNKGIAQNEYEGTDDWYKEQYDIFPQVYSKADDFSWIVSEFVLPAKDQDFKHCIGISFKDWVNVVRKIEENLRPARRNRYYRSPLSNEQLTNLIENNRFIEEFYEYFGTYSDSSIGDMVYIHNYGLTKRDNEAYIVILDSGLSYDIYNKHYSR